MLTRTEILTMPAEQLAEVSAKMMGWTLPRPGKFRPWTPHIDHNDAREVADWVVNWLSVHIKEGSSEMPRFKVYRALQELFFASEEGHFWNMLFHTPEQLLRAILLAFVDNGGEI